MRQVLVIEDDAWQAEMIERQLSHYGFTVMVVHNALDAFAAIDTKMPTAIVLDMMLPGPNGMTFLHELRSHSDLASLPVIVCSTQLLALESLRPYGVEAVLNKTTMENDDVVSALRKVLA